MRGLILHIGGRKMGFGFSEFSLGFGMFGIMFGIIFALVIAVFCAAFVRGFKEWNRNNR